MNTARNILIAGNWKMNGLRESVKQLAFALRQGLSCHPAVELVVLPSFLHLQLVESILAGSAIQLGAQDLTVGEFGAYTGAVSGPMLSDIGCRYVLVGHSERRAIFHEDLNEVAAKFKAAKKAGLIPILCVGETLPERQEQITENIIARQLESVIAECGIAAFSRAIIAYEPVWAIGTGLSATPEQAQAVHAFIRGTIMQHDVEISSTIQILYGGSVKADNAAGLLTMPDIDGALVGGAALDATSFLAIYQAACQQIEKRI